jgi:biopolymer transport protein ExbD
MSLKKGFLGRRFAYEDLNLSKYEVGMYVCIWFSGSFVSFLLITAVREALRFFTYYSVVDDVFLLSKYDTNFYNFFYACLACFFSISLVVSHILQRPSTLRNIKTYRKKTILNDISGFQSFFIFWYFKMAIFFGQLYIGIPIFLYINFSSEYRYLFPTLLVVLYLHYWLTLRVIYKNSIFKIMGISTALIISMSLFLSQLSFADGSRINSSLRKFVISTYIKLDLPVATYPQVAERKYYIREIFLGPLISDTTNVGLYVRNDHRNIGRIDYSDIKKIAESEREKIIEFERDQLTWSINVDKNVKFEFVKKLRLELRKSNVQKIIYGTHHSSHVATKGIMERLRSICSESQQEPCYVNDTAEDFNGSVLEIHISPSFVSLAGHEITLENLKKEVKNFQSENSVNNVVAVTVDDKVLYSFYFQVKDKLRSVFVELRDEESLRKSGKNFEELDQYVDPERQIYNDIRSKWPVNIIEAIDNDEKALVKAMLDKSVKR